MIKEHLSFSANEHGFVILYKGVDIGRSAMPPIPTGLSEDERSLLAEINRSSAESEIKAIVRGCAPLRFVNAIKEVDLRPLPQSEKRKRKDWET